MLTCIWTLDSSLTYIGPEVLFSISVYMISVYIERCHLSANAMLPPDLYATNRTSSSRTHLTHGLELSVRLISTAMPDCAFLTHCILSNYPGEEEHGV